MFRLQMTCVLGPLEDCPATFEPLLHPSYLWVRRIPMPDTRENDDHCPRFYPLPFGRSLALEKTPSFNHENKLVSGKNLLEYLLQKGAKTVTEEQKELVQTSFDKVIPISDAAAVLFYDQLFALDPSLRALFKSDMAEQRAKLMAMLTTAVRSLGRWETLAPAKHIQALRAWLLSACPSGTKAIRLSKRLTTILALMGA
jgi:hypothetical protein